jgi:hypothetical protein
MVYIPLPTPPGVTSPMIIPVSSVPPPSGVNESYALSADPVEVWVEDTPKRAEVTNSSLSRLSHLVKRLESWGLVRREPDPTDGRLTNAILTDAGYAKLVASAPDHVAAVRALVVDEFSPADLADLRESCKRIVTKIESSSWNQELN